MRRKKCKQVVVFIAFIAALLIMPLQTTSHQTWACRDRDAIVCDDPSTCTDCHASRDCWLDYSEQWTYANFRETGTGCGNQDFTAFDTDEAIKDAHLAWQFRYDSDEWEAADVNIWKDSRISPGSGNNIEDCIDNNGWSGYGNCASYLTPYSTVVNANKVQLSGNADNWAQCGSAGGVVCTGPNIKTQIGQNAGWDRDDEIVFWFIDPVSVSNEVITSNNNSDAFTLYITRDENPVLANCPDDSTDEDSNAADISVDLWSCHSDPDDNDFDNKFNVTDQTNTGLIDCYVDQNRYLKCNPPSPNQYSSSGITVEVKDHSLNTDTDVITITVNPVNDPPTFNVSTTASANLTNPAEQGTSVTFKAQIEDPDEGDNVKLLICDNVGLGGAQCSGTTLCFYNSTVDGYKSCSYDTANVTLPIVSWRSYACDSNQTCTNGTTGTFAVNRRPKHPTVFLENVAVWNYTGFFKGSDFVENFDQALESSLASCQEDENGFCDINFTVGASSLGRLRMSDIRIYYIANPRFIFSFQNLTSWFNDTVFEFMIRNNVTAGNFLWTLQTGDLNQINSSLPLELNLTEESFVYIQHNYTAPGSYNVTATVSLGNLSDSQSIAVRVF